MEISKLFGLPAHPLLVHLPVVLVPLAALGAVLVVVRPAWRIRFGTLVAIAAGIGLAGIQLAIGSGEELEERVKESAALERHEGLAGITRLSVLLFFLAVTALVVYDRRRAVLAGPGTPATTPKSPVIVALSAITVATSLLATTAVVQSGHTGAKATWQRTSQEQSGGY